MDTYKPIVRDIIANPDTDERVRDYTDPYPYIKPIENIFAEEKFAIHDQKILDLLYKLSNLTKQLYLYQKHYEVYKYAHEDNNINILNEMKTKVSEAIKILILNYKQYVAEYSDIQKRSNEHIKYLYSTVKNLFSNHPNEVGNYILDISDGGCPNCRTLFNKFIAINRIVKTILNKEISPPFILLSKLLLITTDLQKNDISKLKEYIENENSINDSYTETLSKLENFQNDCEYVGITFEENMVAFASINIEFENLSLEKLNYSTSLLDEIMPYLISHLDIKNCLDIVTPILEKLNNNFSILKNTENNETEINEDTSIENYISSIIGTLTVVFSLYRSCIITCRNYTTLLENIFSQICNFKQKG